MATREAQPDAAEATAGAPTKRSAAWEAFHREAKRLPPLAPGELAERLQDAGPATDDDVPWTFPERTPVEPGER